MFLVNGHKVTVNIKSVDKTDDVLEVMIELVYINLVCEL